MKKTRITAAFERLGSAGRKAFIPYIMAGDVSLDRTRELVLFLERHGADIVELGVPFSDPLADGPTIQRAAERALQNHVTLSGVIQAVKSLRNQTQVPIVLMTYFNPVYKLGLTRFIDDATTAGVDGVIIPDLPPDEETDFIRSCADSGLDTIFLLAPTSTEDRIELVAQASRGFIYYVSITGITGSKISIDTEMRTMIRRIGQMSAKPVAVGFGIKTPQEAKEVADIADGVIVGSSIVNAIHEDKGSLEPYIKALRKAI
ncbi:MAG: tryptophan synthase subunit alpha [Nitrospirae bacterium]|uniref:tryptophan synthase subunit alpha n=1 Tax=Candidatus Magnetobacterium casense TaxID=1455061 RepID=UPI00058DB6FE|nr:tryptophan synthase subunit alpha [Candidatus Magnetobacterium casensis]MBF0339164.1 tryptophan synthase subunit alpha [Nitrospirota bacterium]